MKNEERREKNRLRSEPGDGRTESARDGQCKSRGWPQASPAVPIADVSWLIPPRKPRSLQHWLARKPSLLRQIELE